MSHLLHLAFSRMLKKSASGVLASLRGSTYRSVRLASSLAAALLDGLFEHPAGYSDTISIRNIAMGHCTKTKLFRSLLVLMGWACSVMIIPFPSTRSEKFSLAWPGLFMNDVARRSRPKSAGASRKYGRRRRTCSPSRRPNEKSPAGQEDRTT